MTDITTARSADPDYNQNTKKRVLRDLPVGMDDLLWGADEFAQVLGRPKRTIFDWLTRGILDADKIASGKNGGGSWCSTRRRLLDSLARLAKAGDR